MKKHSLLMTVLLIGSMLHAQTTVNYPQRVANYEQFFTDSGGSFDSGADELGMWANGGGAKQSVAWRTFRDTGLPGGTPTVMGINDSFSITVSATQASFGQIGVALLSSPSSTSSWADRHSNYAVQVNLNGNSGANDPWEVVSTGGTVDASSIGGSTSYADFKFTFTLTSATTMTVSINDGAETFNITLNNQDITGYSVYFADDWNGVANANIYWKPTTEYIYAPTMSLQDHEGNTVLKLSQDREEETFSVNKNVTQLDIFDLSGKMIRSFKGQFSETYTYDISSLAKTLYIVRIETNSGQHQATKLVKL